jgi:hypothetical protein
MIDTMRRGALLSILALTVACSTGTEPGNLRLEVAAHRIKWTAARPAEYTYALARYCFCSPAEQGPVRVRVVGDSVVSRTYVETGDTVVSADARFFPDVDGLFQVVEDAVASGADKIHITWDDHRGFPSLISIDYVAHAADDEIALEVTEQPAIPH